MYNSIETEQTKEHIRDLSKIFSQILNEVINK